MERLVRVVLGLLLGVASFASLAAIPQSPSAGYWSRTADPTVQYSSMQAACQGYVPALQAIFANQPSSTFQLTGCTAVSSTSGRAEVTRYIDGAAYDTFTDGNYYVAGALQCPANSTLSGGTCSCTSPYVEDAAHTSCVAPHSELEDFCSQNAAAKNGFKMSGSVPAAAGLPGTSCYVPDPPFEGGDAGKGCGSILSSAAGVPSADGSRISWAGMGTFDGSVCSATPDAPTPLSRDDPCPGGFQGTVNGVSKCVAAEPDKGIEGVKNTSSTDANGTRNDVKETTRCDGTGCTTTTNTTSTTAGGTVSNTTSTRTESLADKCVKDPKNPVCKKSQGGEGSAVSDMTCDTNASAKGCGGDGAAIGDLYAKKDKTVAQALAKAKDALQASPLGSSVSGFFNVGGGGSCPTSSATIPFLNKTLVIDTWCTSFAANMFVIVKAVLLMLATWMAFRIAIDN